MEPHQDFYFSSKKSVEALDELQAPRAVNKTVEM